MSVAEVNRLPDPDLFRDAQRIAWSVLWTPRSLDETDALLLALIDKFHNVRRG